MSTVMFSTHQVQNVTVEDKVQLRHNGTTFTIRKLHARSADSDAFIDIFPEEGSALDLEIRANVAAREAAKPEQERAA